MTSEITSDATPVEPERFGFILAAAIRALMKADLPPHTLSLLAHHHAMLGGAVENAITSVINRLTIDQFHLEELENRYRDFIGYEPKTLKYQISTFTRGLVNGKLLEMIKRRQIVRRPGAEGWFVVPHWSSDGDTYQEALENVLTRLKKAYSGRFINKCDGKLGPEYLSQTPEKINAMNIVQQAQGTDLLIVAAQLGFKHCGRSSRRACAIMNDGEFSLGAYEVGIILLTHSTNLGIYCAGDKYSPCADGDLDNYVLCFDFEDGNLVLSCRRTRTPNGGYGTASGFLLFE